MTLIRWLLGLVTISLIAGGIAWWWNSQTILVDIATVTRGNLVESIVVEGFSQVTQRMILTAPVNGILERVELKAGDPLQKKDVVATISAPPSPLLDERALEIARTKHRALRAEWLRNTAARETAEANLKQSQKKRTSFTVPAGQAKPLTPELDAEEQARKRELEAAERGEERALSELNAMNAQLGLNYQQPKLVEATADDIKKSRIEVEIPPQSTVRLSQIRSPIHGHVLQIMKSDAGVVAAGTPIMEVGDLKNIEFVFDVLTTEVTRIAVGNVVQLQHWGEENQTLKGRVTLIDPTAKRLLSPLGVEEYRTRVTIVTQDGESVSNRLGHGFRIEGVFQTRESIDVVKVPLGAIFRKAGEWFVFRVKDGNAIETKVELGIRNDREVSVVSGLSDYDLVILFPANRVHSGARVTYR